MSKDDKVVQGISWNYGDLSPEEIREASEYAEGKKIPEVFHAKGGRCLIQVSNIMEQDPVEPTIKGGGRKPYCLRGDLGFSFFNPDISYRGPMDVFDKNPPVVSLRDRIIMMPEDSLFNDLYAGLCETGLGEQTTMNEITKGYVRATRALYFAFLSRAVDRGFIKNVTVIDIERGMPDD